MPRTTKSSPKLATPNKSAKKKLHKEEKAKQQTEEPKPKMPKLSTPTSKTPTKKVGKIIGKQSKSPKAKTPATKTPAKKEQKSKVKKYDGPSKSPSNLAASNKENANTNNNNNNVDEIIRRYSMQSANKSKDEQLSEEYLAEVSAMEESFKEFDSFELKTELVKEQPGQQKTAEQKKMDEQQNNGAATGKEGKEKEPQSGPDDQNKMAESGTAKKRASASRSAVKTMETPKRADKNDEPKSGGKKGNGSPAAGRENKTPVSTKRRTSEKLFKAEEEKKPRRSTRLSTN